MSRICPHLLSLVTFLSRLALELALSSGKEMSFSEGLETNPFLLLECCYFDDSQWYYDHDSDYILGHIVGNTALWFWVYFTLLWRISFVEENFLWVSSSQFHFLSSWRSKNQTLRTKQKMCCAFFICRLLDFLWLIYRILHPVDPRLKISTPGLSVLMKAIPRLHECLRGQAVHHGEDCPVPALIDNRRVWSHGGSGHPLFLLFRLVIWTLRQSAWGDKYSTNLIKRPARYINAPNLSLTIFIEIFV